MSAHSIFSWLGLEEAPASPIVLSALLFGAVVFACGPLPTEYMGRKTLQAYRSCEKKQHTRQISTPRSHVSRRLPSISLINPPVQAPQQSDDQLQCRLLALPFELREQIYLHVFDTRQVHVALREDKPSNTRKPAYFFCRAGQQHGEEPFDAWYEHDDCYHDWNGPSKRKNRHSFTLLLTCRRIYEDAVGIFYATTTFKPANIASLFQLESKLPPQHLNTIRSLELKMSLNHLFSIKDLGGPAVMDNIQYHPEVMQEFLQAMDLLANMRRLRDLRIIIRLHPFALGCWQAIEPTLAAALSRFTGLRSFEVFFFSGLPQDMLGTTDVVEWGSCKVLGTRSMVNRLERLLVVSAT